MSARVTATLQRKCACGQHTAGGEQCEECKKKKLQRRAISDSGPAVAPPIVHEVLRSPGQPLDNATRDFMEPRFGHDFSQVRVHTNERAAESARAVNARAYTVGKHVVFGAGQYVTSAHAGRQLLAHELAHSAQQQMAQGTSSPLMVSDDAAAEREADLAALHMTGDAPHGLKLSPATSRLSRKVNVIKPADNIPNPGGKGAVQTNAQTIQDYLKTICPTGGVIGDAKTGVVTINASFCTPKALPSGVSGPPDPSPAQKSATATGCGCICDLVNSSNQWNIVVDDGSWPHTDFDNPAGSAKPGGTGGTVTAPSPNTPKLWGAGTVSGKTLDIDPWLVLGHELCGHAWLGNSGSHGPDEASPRGEGGHQETVKRENLLRTEHGIDLRGTFKDPDCGESYWRDKSGPGPVNWSSFHAVCANWRKDYNKAHGTSYKMTDKIP
ncbi:MAG TPA: DUF4157 domain-containing protein [Candidatus Angelobacter sp.]